MTGSGNSIFKIINVKRKIFLYTMMICACSFLAPVVAQAQPKAEIRYPGSSKIDLAGPAALAVMKGGRSRVIVQFRLTESQSAAISAMAKAGKGLSIAQARRQTIDRARTHLLDRTLGTAPARSGAKPGAKSAAGPLASLRALHNIPAFALDLNRAELERLAADPAVVSIVEDRLMKPMLDQSVPLIGAPAVWAGGSEGSGTAVAVLDTGSSLTHTMMAGKIAGSACFSTTSAGSNSTSLCPDGTSQQIGGDAGTNCPVDDPATPDVVEGVDGCDHGTHVASTAMGAAFTGSQGKVLQGVARGANLVAVQVFSKFTDSANCGSDPVPCVRSFTSDQDAALDYVLTNAAALNVASINMSLGGGKHAAACDTGVEASTKALIDQLRTMGVATFIAAGNEGFTDGISAPACISSAIAVGATGRQDFVTSFSNSSPLVDVLAPGRFIRAAYPEVAGVSYDAVLSGTSMATPHAAGAFALLRSAHPAASVDDILNALKATGKPVVDTRNAVLKPRIQVDAASDFISAGGSNLADLALTPIAPALVKGMITDPASFAPLVYTLTNNGTAPADWTVSSDQTALMLDQTGGTLAAGASVDVTVSIDPSTLTANQPLSAILSFGGNGQTTTRQVTVLAEGAPANDNFADRITLPSALPITVNANNIMATIEAGEPSFGPGHSVWYEWTPQVSERVDITGVFAGAANPENPVNIYTGTTLSGLTLVASGFAGGTPENPSRLILDAVANQTYILAIDGQSGQFPITEGFFTLSIGSHENRPPVAGNDVFQTTSSLILTANMRQKSLLRSSRSLVNDYDPDGDAFSTTAVNGTPLGTGPETQFTLPSGAIIRVKPDGNFSYNPNGVFDSLAPGTKTSDAFTYTISDGALTDSATVTIDVFVDNARPQRQLNASILSGGSGFIFKGRVFDERTGVSVQSAGDVNGDGINDIVIGAARGENRQFSREGLVYVVYGSASGFPSILDPTMLNGSNGFVLSGINNGDLFGTGVTNAGDINGDGHDDLAIGAPGSDPNNTFNAGAVYIVYGKAGGFPANIDLASLNGSNGFVINGTTSFGEIGHIVRPAGDFNADGIADLLISGSRSSIYVIYGKTTPFSAVFDLASVDQGSALRIDGIPVDTFSGQAIDSGDFNGDGISDLLVGAAPEKPDTDSGFAYVLMGSATPFPASIILSPVDGSSSAFQLDGTNGFIIDGILAGDLTGDAVANAGDVNGDGIDDMLVGAPFASNGNFPLAGATYLIYGKASGNPARLDMGSLDGTNGTVINGVNALEESGLALSTAGDVDHDGIDDFLIGAPKAGRSGRHDSGAVYLVYGSTSGFGATLSLSGLNANSGLVIHGIDADNMAGAALGTAGDINNDGIDDFLIGAPNINPFSGDFTNRTAGAVYAVFGSPSPLGSLGDLPVAVNDTFATDEDTSISGNLLADNGAGADRDPGSGSLNVVRINGSAGNVGNPVSLPSGAVLTVMANGTFSFDPSGHFDSLGVFDNTTDSFTYQIENTSGGADAASVTIAISGVNDPPSGAVTISGTLSKGSTLTADASALTDPEGLGSFTYQWFRNGERGFAIANGPSYTLTQADVGKFLEVSVSYTDGGFSFERLFSAPTGTIAGNNTPPTGAVVITGTAMQGQTLTADASGVADADGLGAFSYQWRRNGTNIAGATASAYTLVQADVGKTMDVVVSYTDGFGTAESVTSSATAPVANINDAPTGTVVITGTAMQGQTLTADASGVADADGLGTFSYQWRRNGTNIAGATASAYTLVAADVGSTIDVVVSYTDGFGTAESVTSAPTGTVQGLAQFTLTVSTTGPGSGTLTSAPAGIDCGTDCTQDYDDGTSVTLSHAAAADSVFNGWSGDCTGSGACVVAMDQARSVSARFELSNPGATTLFSSVLPSARSGSTGGGASAPGTSGAQAAGGPITVFASVINAGANPAQSCQIVIPAGAPVTLSYQETNAANVPTGVIDQPFDLAAGQGRSFVLAFTPTAVSSGVDVFPDVMCDNANVDAIPGVNTVFLSIGNHPVPDILSIGATPSGDGIITVPTGSISFMTASATNIGAGDAAGSQDAAVTVSADTGAAALPLLLQVCETDAASTCITPLGTGPVSTVIGSGPSFFAVFVTDQSSTGIPLDPANARVFLRFTDASGTVRSVTSAAVTAPAPADAPVRAAALPQGRWAVMVRKSTGLHHAQAPGVLYVRANGDAWLESAGKTLPVRFRAANDSAAPGSFTMLTGKSALPGHFIPDYALTIGSEQPESRLRIRGVHDMRKLPETMAH